MQEEYSVIGRKKSLIKFAIFVAVVLVAIPVLAALGISLDGGRTTIDTVTVVGCTLQIKVNNLDAATFNVRVIDNAFVRFSQDYVQAGAGSFTATYPIVGNPNNMGATGIAITVRKNGVPTVLLDLFSYSDVTGTTCRLAIEAAATDASCSSTATILPGSVVGDLPLGGRAYWAPGKITPEVFIKPGTYWVVDAFVDDDNRQWNKLYISCQYLWVPAEWMSPTFDGPWNGEALPLPSNLSAEEYAEFQLAASAAGVSLGS